MEETEYGTEWWEDGEELRLTVEDACGGLRLDAFLSSATSLTRSAAVRLIESGRVRREDSDKRPDKKDKVKPGECFLVEIPSPEPAEALPENLPLNVIFEDAHIIVVNKPKGMVVHPAPGNLSGTLVNALLYHCKGSLSGIGGVVRPGIVHRIDKDTEGLLVVAKNDAAHLYLAEEIRHHRVRRIYRAIVLGNLREDRGTVNAPIGRHPVDRKRMAVIRDPAKRSREAVTHWEVLERFGRFTLIRCELETGRTHQIRVHMSSVGHPLLGDSLYGGGGTAFEKQHKSLIEGQCLIATELRLTHPVSKEEMTFFAKEPAEFQSLLSLLRTATP